jgi:F0F1-type ATP synthase epsilon subunit
MRLKVLTKEATQVDQEAHRVHFTTLHGEMEILPMHASSVVVLKPGTLKYDESSIGIGSGIARIHNDHILVLAEAM